MTMDLRQEMKQARHRTDEQFALMSPEGFYQRPIPERHRLIFYLGHLDAFDWNQICRSTLGLPSFHPSFDQLFEAGIDPPLGESPQDRPSDWPSVEEVLKYIARIRQVIDKNVDVVPDAILQVAIEHRFMHAETNAYLLEQLAPKFKCPTPSLPHLHARDPDHQMIDIPEGTTTVGRQAEEGFGWDNEFSAHEVFVPAFSINRYKVTNQQYLSFVRDGGEPPLPWNERKGEWWLRTMSGEVPLPLHWPVYVTHRQAQNYANWAGMALPTEAQFHRAAYGTVDEGDRPFPWGIESPEPKHGNFNFVRWEPISVNSSPLGESCFGIAQLVGNGWEWTGTPFRPFDGFKPLPSYPLYSTRFFDEDHFVVKGGGPFTASRLLRRSFRNWFRRDYPYAHIGFRCVKN